MQCIRVHMTWRAYVRACAKYIRYVTHIHDTCKYMHLHNKHIHDIRYALKQAYT